MTNIALDYRVLDIIRTPPVTVGIQDCVQRLAMAPDRTQGGLTSSLNVVADCLLRCASTNH